MLYLLASATLGMLYFAWVSWKEQESRALKIAAMLAVGFGITTYISIFFTLRIYIAIIITILGAVGITVILLLLPIGKLPPEKPQPVKRFDERTLVFARARLKPGTARYLEYYTRHPEHQTPDDITRARPGLLKPGSRHANPYAFSSADSSFSLIDTIQPQVEGSPSPEQLLLDPAEATAMVKGLAKYYGALQVGITELRPYHVYSHIGRGSGEYGSELPVEHKYAIAFTVEMDFEMVGSAPTAPITLESSRQYVESAVVATQLAETIRLWGSPARGHIDGNYRVICPLVARDAGLGEIGRMSILMTPKLGPRVRLAVVTTDLELIPDRAPPMMDMIDFCMICKKCAENCPSRSISLGEPAIEENGVRRWVLNAETCFAYWNELGTDCGICMKVCPYSHPDNLTHNLVRWGIKKSGFFRRGALILDDLFYGRIQAPKPPPSWLKR